MSDKRSEFLELIARVRTIQLNGRHSADVLAWAQRWVLHLPDEALTELECLTDARALEFQVLPAELMALRRYGEHVI